MSLLYSLESIYQYHHIVELLLGVLLSNFVFQWIRKPGASPRGLVSLQGPTGLPIIGNLGSFLATKTPELLVHKWAKKYGSLYSLWLGNQRFVILSDPNVVKDLLVSQGATFSSRKDFFIKCQTIFAGRGIAATPPNAKWRAHRGIAKRWLDKGPVDSYNDDLVPECTKLLQQLYVAADPIRSVDRYVANNIFKIVLGADEESLGHKYDKLLHMAWEFFDCTGPVSNAVDFIPLLQYLPNPMTTRARRVHAVAIEIIGGIMDDMRERLQAGEFIPDCLIKSLLENQDKEHHDRLDIIMLCMALMIAGFASVTSVVRAFVKVVSRHPEVQERAHEELDRVVGKDKLPTVGDEDELHYIRSIIKEVERLHTPLWLGTPHFSTQDFTYRGYLIPKDTVIVVNAYTIHHDPQRYPDPYSFKPERYLDDKLPPSESVNAKDPMQRDHWTFGAGRRICPGIHLAEREIFLAVSYMFWAFKMEAIPGERGSLESLSGRDPLPNHRIRMVPRLENVGDVIGF